MNKKDLTKEKEKRELADEQKLIDAINKKHEEEYNKVLLKEQIKKVKVEKIKKQNERLMKFKKIALATIVIVLVGMIISYFSKESEDFMNACLNAGNSEIVCERNR